MSWGISGWGISDYGGADFFATNHEPPDDSTGNSRTPTISFTLVSQTGDVTINTINLTTNDIQLIVNGIFTSNAFGTIDNTNPANVNVIAHVTSAFSPLAVVGVIVSAQNASLTFASVGTTWQFTVNSTIRTFMTYIIRSFERILRVAI